MCSIFVSWTYVRSPVHFDPSIFSFVFFFFFLFKKPKEKLEKKKRKKKMRKIKSLEKSSLSSSSSSSLQTYSQSHKQMHFEYTMEEGSSSESGGCTGIHKETRIEKRSCQSYINVLM